MDYQEIFNEKFIEFRESGDNQELAARKAIKYIENRMPVTISVQERKELMPSYNLLTNEKKIRRKWFRKKTNNNFELVLLLIMLLLIVGVSIIFLLFGFI